VNQRHELLQSIHIEEYTLETNLITKPEVNVNLLNKRIEEFGKSVQAKDFNLSWKLFTNEKGMAKLEIGPCRGKPMISGNP
jgi:SsrA-binding protein